MKIRPMIAARENALRHPSPLETALYFDDAGEESERGVVAVRSRRGCLVIDLVSGDEVWRSPFDLTDDEWDT